MQLCVIPGDGIGPEVIAAALRVLHAVAPEVEILEAEAGWGTFQKTGGALPDATLAAARAADAVLFGAVASPSQPVPGYRSPIVALRRELDLYANIRPVYRHEIRDTRYEQGIESHVSRLVVVRENTEDLYIGRERLEDDGDTAIAERVITRRASERIARVAFELALSRQSAVGSRQSAGEGRHETRDMRHEIQEENQPSTTYSHSKLKTQHSKLTSPKVTIVHKANVLRVTDGLFREAALHVARQYPAVEVEELLVDTAAMHLARSPERFDVIVTTNMFGDILSDIACIHGGGLGLASSANLGDTRALFEPVHGAAPDIVGKGTANPLAAVGCIAMLLDWQQQPTLAQTVREAVTTVLQDGPHTPDLGGHAATSDVVDAVIAQMKNLEKPLSF